MDPVHVISFTDIICYFGLIQKSCIKAPGLLGNQLAVQNFAAMPFVFKNNSKEVTSPRKIHKIALEASNPHIFPTTTLNSVIFEQKF
jgi:hypothetical protein